MAVEPDARYRINLLVSYLDGPRAVVFVIVVFSALGLVAADFLADRLGPYDRAAIEPAGAIEIVKRCAITGGGHVKAVEARPLDRAGRSHRHVQAGEPSSNGKADGIDAHASASR